MTKTTSRGFRNNNPLNIRRTHQTFLGEVESTDRAFKAFSSMAYGFRAALVILRTYMYKYGLYTPEDIIRRWAPPVENPTAKYIDAVCCWSGILPKNHRIDFADRETMCRFVLAMARFECGVKFDLAIAYEAYDMLK